MGITIKSIPNESSADYNIRLAHHILATDYNIITDIKEGLSNGQPYKYLRYNYWKQLPKEVYYIINHLVTEDTIDDDDTLPKYSYRFAGWRM